MQIMAIQQELQLYGDVVAEIQDQEQGDNIIDDDLDVRDERREVLENNL